MGWVKIKYPCGLEIEKTSWHYYHADKEDTDMYKYGCPIHGKKCKALKK